MSRGHGRASSVALGFLAEPTVEAEGTSQLSVEEVRWASRDVQTSRTATYVSLSFPTSEDVVTGGVAKRTACF